MTKHRNTAGEQSPSVSENLDLITIFQVFGVLPWDDKEKCDWNKEETTTGDFVIGQKTHTTTRSLSLSVCVCVCVLITVGDNSVVFVSL